jgi:hypothetical protein
LRAKPRGRTPPSIHHHNTPRRGCVFVIEVPLAAPHAETAHSLVG